MPSTNDQILAALGRIEGLLLRLLESLAEDDEERPTHDLDGNVTPVAMSNGRSL